MSGWFGCFGSELSCVCLFRARSSLRWLDLDLSYSLHCLKGVICIGDYIADYYTGS